MMRLPWPPLLLHYYITYRCNAGCWFCEFGRHQPKIRIPDAQLDQVCTNLIAARRLGVKFVDFTGGEPLLHPDLAAMLQAARQLRFLTSVTTNCRLYEKSAEKIKGLVSYLHFSLDAANATAHNQMRSGNFYQSVMNSLTLAQQLGERPDLLFTVSRRNLAELPALVALAQEKHCMLIVNPLFGAFPADQLTADDLNFIKRFASQPLVYINRALHQLRRQGGNDMNRPRCAVVSAAIVIAPDDHLLLPCYHHHQQRLAIHGQLESVWHSQAVSRARKLQGRYRFCQGCTLNCYFDPSFYYYLDEMFFKSLMAKAKYVWDKEIQVGFFKLYNYIDSRKGAKTRKGERLNLL